MDDIDDIEESRITRYVMKQASLEEEAEVRRWIAADPERQAFVDSLARVWELGELPLNDWNTRTAWAEFAARREVQRRGRPAARQHARGGRRARGGRPDKARRSGWRAGGFGWPFRIAAAIVVTIGGALLWRQTQTSGDSMSARVELHEYATRPAQRAELRLTDGTRVMLNVDSRVRVPEDFGSTTREVSLDGEAFFDVRHDPSRPFRVHTTRGAVEVLGTEFVVGAYVESDAMEVAVVSGSVGLRNPAPRGADTATGHATRSDLLARLTRGDVATLDSTGVPNVRRGVDLSPYTDWIDGKLVFKAMPLGEALPRIERWYDVQFQLADDALAERLLTATFQNEPLAGVLDLLALSFDLSVERREHVIILAPGTPGAGTGSR